MDVSLNTCLLNLVFPYWYLLFKVYPEEGLSVQLDGTASNGIPPTTESPTILQIDWRCEKKANLPYLVNVTIPVEGYDPVVFTLGKHCGTRIQL
jgi:hypothetical protein